MTATQSNPYLCEDKRRLLFSIQAGALYRGVLAIIDLKPESAKLSLYPNT